MTEQELSQIQSPIKLVVLRAMNETLKQATIRTVVMSFVAKKTGDNDEAARFADKGVALCDRGEYIVGLYNEERAKPKIHLRTFKWYRGKDTNGGDNVTVQILFPAAVPDSIIRQLGEYWMPTKDVPDTHVHTDPIHIYRNAKHAMLSLRMVGTPKGKEFYDESFKALTTVTS